MITQERLKELFYYDPQSGLLYNRTTRSSKALKGKLSGGPDGYGYLRLVVDKGQYMQHCLVWIMHYGHPLPEVIDHKDHNGLNNRLENLRAATVSQNGMNRRAAKGIYRRKGRGPGTKEWVASWVESGRKRLKYFYTKQEALNHRHLMQSTHYGEFSPTASRAD